MTTLDTIVSYEGGVYSPWALILFGISAILFVLAIVLQDKDVSYSGLFLVFAIVALVIGLCIKRTDQTEYTKYKVYISDPAYPAQQLIENYKIIEQDGFVLTIREKEGDPS